MHDVELLSRFENGDAEAFGVLLTRHQQPVYNFILRSVRHPDTAADLLQETFTRVIQRSQEFNRQSKFSTWLYTIARNLCIDHARRMKHRRHASLDAPTRSDPEGGAGATLGERVESGDPDTERHAAAGRLRDRIAEAVAELPEEQREVFLMRQLQHLPFAEIAAVVGVSENTVKSRMRYALERLQGALGDYREHLEALA